MPEIARAILFGSLVRGIPTPRSDADLLLVVRESRFDQARDRVPDALAALSPLPCPLDLFVLTEGEVERGAREGNPLIREILSYGVDLLAATGTSSAMGA